MYLQEQTEGVADPREKLLAVFGAYEEWLVGEDFRGCAFANAAAEIPDPDHPARIVAQRHKEGVREHMAALAKEAGFDEPEALAERLLLLLEGAAAAAAMRRSGEPLRGGAFRRAGAPGRPVALLISAKRSIVMMCSIEKLLSIQATDWPLRASSSCWNRSSPE